MNSKIISVFLICTSFAFAQNNKIVLIDPGHGGHDSGAVGYAGVKEKDITLAISLKLINELEKQGITGIVTRKADIFIPIKNKDHRSQLTRDMNASVFISIHLNSGNFNGSGVECFISKYKGADHNKRKSVILSHLILEKLNKNLGFKSRGISFEDFSVLRNTIEFCPSILLELGFISNKEELLYITGSGSDLIARNIAYAIKEYLKL